MFSSESTCNPHKNKLSGKRYNDTTSNQKLSATHTRTNQLDQKPTVHWIRDIDSNGDHIDTVPVDDIDGSNGKNNDRSGL